MPFTDVLNVLNHVASVGSSKEKLSIIRTQAKKTPLLEKVIFYAYNNLYAFKISNVNPSPLITRNSTPEKIFDFLDYMLSKKGATNQDRSQLARLASYSESTLEVVNRILAKDLRCGLGVKMFRKVFPDIPVHEVKLCKDDVDKFKKKAGKVSNACWSNKLDGVRIWAIAEVDDTVRYISRNGKEYPNFYVFNEECLAIRNRYFGSNPIKPFVLDGECITKEVDFQKQMQQVRRLKDADPSEFRLCVFDIPQSKNPFHMRYATLKEIIGKEHKLVSYVPHTTLTSFDQIEELKELAAERDEEGIVLKTWDGFYDFARHDDWCKVKCFKTDEFPVTGWVYGEGKYKDLMGKLLIDVDGVTVGVGSGFSDKQRKLFMTDTPEMIEVKYLRKTPDGSLYLPTFVCERGDK